LANAWTSHCAAQRNESASGDDAMAFLPVLHIRQANGVIRVFLNLAVDVQYDQWQQLFLHADLVDGAQAIVKVRGRVDVGAPLADVGIEIDLETVLVDGIEGFAFRWLETLPVGNLLVITVSQVNPLMGFQ
jgi:hypothetical protein